MATESQIDLVIEHLQHNYLHAEKEYTEPVYRLVIDGFLHETDDIAIAAAKTAQVHYILDSYRPTLGREIRQYSELDWDERKNRAADLIYEASGLLDDPVLGTDSLDFAKLLFLPPDHPSLANKDLLRPDISRAIQKRIQNRADIEKLAELDILAIVIWHISSALRDTPTESIIPPRARNMSQANQGVPHYGQPHEREGYTLDDLSKTKQSNSAILIRRLDRELSEHTKNRYSVIKDLANIAILRVEKGTGWRAIFEKDPKLCTRQNVASILRNRTTPETHSAAKRFLYGKAK